MRRTALKPGRRTSSGVDAEVWRDGLGPCAHCDEVIDVDGHHIIPKRVLKAHGLREFLADHRNRLPLCRRRHERHENRVEPVTRDMLPAEAWEFAAAVGLEWYLERHYPEAEELAA